MSNYKRWHCGPNTGPEPSCAMNTNRETAARGKRSAETLSECDMEDSVQQLRCRVRKVQKRCTNLEAENQMLKRKIEDADAEMESRKEKAETERDNWRKAETQLFDTELALSDETKARTKAEENLKEAEKATEDAKKANHGGREEATGPSAENPALRHRDHLDDKQGRSKAGGGVKA
ncbi:hypothetical protein M011DRAFT_291219 [Sporormia fimetaria CBS 119925]|uniref:Uncharacterized protein n=1 Tax=Sporormia fimetaria CBS 119925 TaxID=1340428 RepID=A0A6A6UVE1_9PLEO|nr:hypothetical protein M011DRAFT_291219 [Sporormia fimetaria CBS 119925]